MKHHIIKGLDHYRVTEPLFEGTRVVLSHRNERYSPAYIQGISGAAFRIVGICPCAPTCNCMMDTLDLLALLGYETTALQIHVEETDPTERLQEVLVILRNEIGRDRAVLFWNAFTICEWDVVCGFDADEKLLFGRGSYLGLDKETYASADESRILTAEARMEYEVILIGEKTGTLDARKAELAALREAVRHARSKQNENKCGGDTWVMIEGLLCYDRWVDDFKSNPSKVPGPGDTYCLSVYRSTHRAAGQFLHELASKYPQGRLEPSRRTLHRGGRGIGSMLHSDVSRRQST